MVEIQLPFTHRTLFWVMFHLGLFEVADLHCVLLWFLGLSTFLGMVVTYFASSELFRIFFKMVFGIVVLGLLHGLCFLPVWLAIFCRHNIGFIAEKEDIDHNSAIISPM